jgi:hypothetical protein
MALKPSRRDLLGGIGMAAASIVGSVRGLTPMFASRTAKGAQISAEQSKRQMRCAQIKADAALANTDMPIPCNRTNGDDEQYPNRIGSYHKGLLHDEIGEVDAQAYRALLRALESGPPADFEGVPLGGSSKISNPQGGLAFDLQACDSHQTFIATPPALSSAWRAAEAVEDYWMASLRDVNFEDYATNPLAVAAIAELNRLSDFRGPRQANRVTSRTLFRGCLPGDLAGPYISQFLLRPFKFGAAV